MLIAHIPALPLRYRGKRGSVGLVLEATDGLCQLYALRLQRGGGFANGGGWLLGT
ncbi:hypothetical protein [Edwardsiella hoshinae]|uniref:hypothetical protein n=1 Tax=Edwardsiella hoshinae TaxID=93378 RepID=UPI000A5B5120|nr:hypothetical protein [Edwardsiella hoshinae]